MGFRVRGVSVLFSEPKIPQFRSNEAAVIGVDVSVLFSEPKIPQCAGSARPEGAGVPRFSALQRAENSSIIGAPNIEELQRAVSVLFSEPKIPQFVNVSPPQTDRRGFSALQRAENSSIRSARSAARCCATVSVLFSEPKIPQLPSPAAG